MILSPDLKCKVWRDDSGALRLRVAGKARAGLVLAGADKTAVEGLVPLPKPEALAGKLPDLVRGEDLTITLPRAVVVLAAGGEPQVKPPREVKPDQVKDWQELAEGIYKAVSDRAYAGEIVKLLNRCGMVLKHHPEVVAWAKARDKEDGAT